MEIKNYGRVGDALPVPNLTVLQRESYSRFLQDDALPGRRKDFGLEAILRETFPIKSYDGGRRWSTCTMSWAGPDTRRKRAAG